MGATLNTPAPTDALVVLRLPVTGPGADAMDRGAGGAEGLARAIAHADAWEEFGSVSLVLRTAPIPLLGVIGRFDAAARARLTALQWQLDNVLPRLLLLGYRDVERGAERLAEALLARFGRGAIAGHRFTAIPRGGHVVLGLLSYALGLSAAQLAYAEADDRPLVVVDDCALSGLRFGQVLESLDRDAHVVFAPLLMAPELRAVIERDPRVRACVSAYELRDAAPGRLGEAGHALWQARWRQRQGTSTYWIGRPQHVCFPWNEPDIAVWNPERDREEPGWPLLPPERCLKHRPLGRAARVRLQVQPTGRGRLRPAEDVLFGGFEDRTVIGKPSWSSCLTLDGVAAAMWGALVADGDASAAAAVVARQYDADLDRVEADVRAFVTTLQRRDVLTS
jgi:hypothetical protein